MSTATISLVGACSTGQHAQISLSINGGGSQNFSITADEVQGGFNSEEVRRAMITLIKFHCIGKTLAQTKSALQTGITVSTS